MSFIIIFVYKLFSGQDVRYLDKVGLMIIIIGGSLFSPFILTLPSHVNALMKFNPKIQSHYILDVLQVSTTRDAPLPADFAIHAEIFPRALAL